MKTWLPACLIVFFLSTVNGWAAQPLIDAQMDQVIAGDLLPTCSGAGLACAANLSSSATMTNTTTNSNGVTTTTTTNTFSCTAATCANQVTSGGTNIPTTCTSNCSISDKVANGATNIFGSLTTGTPPNLPTFPVPPQLPSITNPLPPLTIPSGG